MELFFRVVIETQTIRDVGRIHEHQLKILYWKISKDQLKSFTSGAMEEGELSSLRPDHVIGL